MMIGTASDRMALVDMDGVLADFNGAVLARVAH